MAIKYYPGKKPLNLAFQYRKFKQVKPEFECVLEQATLTCRGIVQPTAASEKYTIRIQYQLGQTPHVFVESPVLQQRPEEKIPHLYRDGSLCLYYPKWREWDSTMYLVERIIPWTSLWLFYYECWLATGEWMGGGKHP